MVPTSLDLSFGASMAALSAFTATLPWTHRAAPIRAVIVDDDPLVREFVDRALRAAGCETVVASDGPEALEMAAHFGAFDVLLADVVMPQMKGDELARQLRQRQPDLKVLYLTGLQRRALQRQGNTLGA